MIKNKISKKLGTGLMALMLVAGATGTMALTSKPTVVEACPIGSQPLFCSEIQFSIDYAIPTSYYSKDWTPYYLNDVVNIQKALASFGFNVVADGRFGTSTENAVKSFQRFHGFAADGIVGSVTWGAIRSHYFTHVYWLSK
ncbi:MAG TPA: peptidoglycan-binding domain-containing protein [Candidatus Paceibacterota bacterium]